MTILFFFNLKICYVFLKNCSTLRWFFNKLFGNTKNYLYFAEFYQKSGRKNNIQENTVIISMFLFVVVWGAGKSFAFNVADGRNSRDVEEKI